MLGTAEEALFIRDWFIASKNDYTAPRTPEGWRRLGAGVSRCVFLSEATGVVYKVEKRYSNEGSGQSNRKEAEAIRKFYLRKLPADCRLPRFYLHELDGKPVMAMEAFTTLLRDALDPQSYAGTRSQLELLTRLWDLHDQNLAVDEVNKQLVIIDWGC